MHDARRSIAIAIANANARSQLEIGHAPTPYGFTATCDLARPLLSLNLDIRHTGDTPSKPRSIVVTDDTGAFHANDTLPPLAPNASTIYRVDVRYVPGGTPIVGSHPVSLIEFIDTSDGCLSPSRMATPRTTPSVGRPSPSPRQRTPETSMLLHRVPRIRDWWAHSFAPASSRRATSSSFGIGKAMRGHRRATTTTSLRSSSSAITPPRSPIARRSHWTSLGSSSGAGVVPTDAGPVISTDVTTLVAPCSRAELNVGFAFGNDDENLGAFPKKTCVAEDASPTLNKVYY
jgi:hypothetical protein